MIQVWSAVTSLLLLGIASLPATQAQQAMKPQSAAPAVAPMAAREPDGDKPKLELDRLRAEIAKLRAETAKVQAESRNVQPWYGQLLGAVIGVVVGVAGLFATGLFGLSTALRARIGTFDMKLYEDRVKGYGNMIAATQAFAMHFPERLVDQKVCERTGRLLREEFFGMTGWLLTDNARARYMTLEHALSRAARAEGLNVPKNQQDYANWISQSQLDEYREILGLNSGEAQTEIDACTKHQFGKAHDDDWLRRALGGERRPNDEKCDPVTAAAKLFQDYVVLQFASSRLRTELARDVSSRRPLADLKGAPRA